MNKKIEEIKNSINLGDLVEKRDDLYFATVEKKDLVGVLTQLRDYYGFTRLTALTAVDWLEDGKFQLSYNLYNREIHLNLIIRVFLDRDNAEMNSIHSLWPAAKTYQRELREMFGINFPFSPDVDKPFILEGWDYEKNLPPYRRDFDTKKYSEETYFPRGNRKTYDPAEYMREKMFKDFPERKIGGKK